MIALDMKRYLIRNTIGCFLILAFLFNGMAPDVMTLVGHATRQVAEHALAAQDDTKSERNAEERQTDPRTEFFPDPSSSFYIDPAPFFGPGAPLIPRNTVFFKAVPIPVPTPPPNTMLA